MGTLRRGMAMLGVVIAASMAALAGVPRHYEASSDTSWGARARFRGGKPTKIKNRGEAREFNRKKNKAARKARGNNRSR